MLPFEWLEQAYERISPYIFQTSLTYDSQNDLYLKWENHQVTGSFKVRGALNKVLSLEEWELERGLVTASAGNHGQGVALAGRIRPSRVIVFASEHAIPNKLQAMKDLGAEIHLVPGGYDKAELAGITYARERSATWVSPYNDGLIIAGQGTIALEVFEQLKFAHPITWVVPAGGGGLLSGVGCALERMSSGAKLVGVQSEASSFLHHIFHQGTQAEVIELPSLADGLSGPVENGSVTVSLVKQYASDFVLVSENEIRHAIRYAWDVYHECIEGSAAVALASVLSGKVSSRPALLVLTGGNINPTDLEQILR